MSNVATLETGLVEAACAQYEPDIRAEVLWLAAYTRERCAGEIGALASRATKLGFSTSDTTFSRILRGKLYDAFGKPIIKLSVFWDVIAALRKLDSREAMQGQVPFIETSTWEDIRDYIDVKSAPDTVCKFGLIIGPTGAQKTACIRHYQRLNNHGRTVRMEAPEKPTMGLFLSKLARCYGVAEFTTTAAKRVRITANVNEQSVLIIDNIQRMYVDAAGWNQPVFNFLQQLQDDTHCTIIMVCVPEFELTLEQQIKGKGYFEQFEGRVGGKGEFLVLPQFTPREDVIAIAKAFKVVDAGKHGAELEKIARQRGRIRILFNALQKAERQARALSSPITIEMVREAAHLEG